MTDRVVAYVDGFNLYFGLKAAQGRKHLWLDLQVLVERMIRDDQALQEVQYFTARVRNDVAAARRQATYLDALGSYCPKVHRVEGRFQERTRNCWDCGAQWIGYEEKETYVNIAVALVGGAVQGSYDTALLISGDGDLRPAVTAVKRLRPEKRIIAVFPPRRNAAGLIAVVDAYIRIGPDKIRNAQLPPKIVTKDGVILERPDHWK
jgi:uncharacterized LabA/DUF88 family protein